MDLQKYTQTEESWRAGRDDYLRMENSWLALAGLFWLSEGDNKVGSAATNAVILPERAPEWLGIFVKDGAKVKLIVSAGHTVTVDNVETLEADMRPDMKGSPNVVKWGDISMIVIQRGESYAVRIWDNARSERESFPGRTWYPIDPEARIEARYERFKAPEQMHVDTTIGTELAVTASGLVHFELGGQAHSLVVSESVVNGLSISFRDETNGSETYPAGRYLMTELPDGDSVVIDFNRTYNPPCAVTDFATCPLPPAQNRLPVAVRAGELYSH